MILYSKPSMKLITKDQIRLIDSLKIDRRMSLVEKAGYFGLNLIYPKDLNCGGYFDSIKREIAIDSRIKSTDIPTILSHELSHVIQELTVSYCAKTISESIAYEQQTESISNLLIKKLFLNESKTYETYFTRGDWIWLNEYYGGYYQNDLEEVLVV